MAMDILNVSNEVDGIVIILELKVSKIIEELVVIVGWIMTGNVDSTDDAKSDVEFIYMEVLNKSPEIDSLLGTIDVDNCELMATVGWIMTGNVESIVEFKSEIEVIITESDVVFGKIVTLVCSPESFLDIYTVVSSDLISLYDRFSDCKMSDVSEVI